MRKYFAVVLAFGLIGLATPAFGFCHGCGRRAAYYAPAPVTTYYAPVATTAYYAPTTTYYAPVATTAYYAPTTTYYAPATTAYYAPTTTYYAPAATTAFYAPTTTYYAPTTTYYAPAVVPRAAYYPGVLGWRARRALRWGAPVVVPY